MKQLYIFIGFLSLLLCNPLFSQTGRVGIGESSPGSKGSIKGNLSVGSTYSSQPAPTDGAIIQGRVGIGTSNPNSGAVLDIQSNDKGILIPRVSGTGSVTTPSTGMLVYNILDNRFYYYDGSQWREMAISGSGGVTGATGPTGAKGDTGSTGEKGDTGADGAAGPQGIQGPAGAQGITGATGNQGVQGIQGPAGAQGPQGIQGPAGAQGVTGATGNNGTAGTNGVTGATGATGNQGVQGIQGPAGAQGPQGIQGPAGAQGITGATGTNGTNGVTGPTGLLSAGVTGATPYFNGSSWVVNSTNIYNNGGNVGIGATAGNVKLRVSGDIEATGQIRATGWLTGSGTGQGAEIGVSSGYSYFFGYDRTASAYTPLRVVGSTIDLRHSDAASDLFINTLGNVGIGNSAPNQKLDVSGNINTTGHISQGPLIAHPNVTWSAGGTSTGAVIIKLPGTVANYGMLHMQIDVYEYGSTGVTTYYIGGHNWNGLWYNYNCHTVGNSDKKIRLAVKDNQYAVVLGEQGSTWSYGHVVLSKITNGGYYSGVINLAGAYSATQDNSAESYTWISSDLSRVVLEAGNGSTNYLARWTSPTTLGTGISFDNGTRVGIGTASPSVRFHVSGGGAIIGTNSSGSSNRTLTVLNDGQAQINFGSYPYDWSPAIQIQNNDNTKMLWLSPGGSGTYSAHNARLLANGTGLDILTGSNAAMATFTSGGNFGVGTMSPSYKLTVYGAASNYPAWVGSPDGYLAFGPANTGWSHFQTDRPRYYFNKGISVDEGLIGSYDENLQLQTSGTTRMTILTSNGNVGIAEANPAEKLDVNGNILYDGLLKENTSAPTTYEVTTKRYHASSRYGTSGRTSIPLDMTIINELCGDRDGCVVRLFMRKWSLETQTAAATRGPYVLTYNAADGRWRANDNEGRIGFEGTQHAFQWWDCYLTDGRYTSGTNFGDLGDGLALLNWNSDYTYTNKTCEITFED